MLREINAPFTCCTRKRYNQLTEVQKRDLSIKKLASLTGLLINPAVYFDTIHECLTTLGRSISAGELHARTDLRIADNPKTIMKR